MCLFPFIKTFTLHNVLFFQWKIIALLSTKEIIDIFSETNNYRRKNYTKWHEYTQHCTCLRSKINANMFMNESICRFKIHNRSEYFTLDCQINIPHLLVNFLILPPSTYDYFDFPFLLFKIFFAHCNKIDDLNVNIPISKHQ